MVAQVIPLTQGWSMISSWIAPLNPELESIWADIVGANHLTLLAGINGLYLPAPFNINTLGNWDTTKGYKILMSTADELTLSGNEIEEKTVSFSPGAHIIPVLTNQITPLNEVFDEPETDILYLMDIYTNEVYWPGGDIYTLTDLIPGRGYLANFNNAVTLTFPPLSNFKVDIAKNLPPEIGPWPCLRTSAFHLISISAQAVKDLAYTDYIGAFDKQGNCVGYTEIGKSGQNVLLTVYGDEAITHQLDGLSEGEALLFRSFNRDDHSEKEISAIFNPTFPNHDGLFTTGGLSAIVDFKAGATGMGESNQLSQIRLYPNPAKDKLNLVFENREIDAGTHIELLTSTGSIALEKDILQKQSSLDIKHLQPGVYVLKIFQKGNYSIIKVVVQ
jgi:hypothetical protein